MLKNNRNTQTLVAALIGLTTGVTLTSTRHYRPTPRNLPAARKQIDAIDKQLSALIQQRFAVVTAVADIKARTQVPVLNKDREQQVLDRVAQQVPAELAAPTQQIFTAIMAASRAYQHARLGHQK